MELLEGFDAFSPDSILTVAAVIVAVAVIGGLLVMLVGGRG